MIYGYLSENKCEPDTQTFLPYLSWAELYEYLSEKYVVC